MTTPCDAVLAELLAEDFEALASEMPTLPAPAMRDELAEATKRLRRTVAISVVVLGVTTVATAIVLVVVV